MTKLTVSEAARQWGLSRGLLYKDMHDGKLAYEKDNRDKKRIDASEMIRLYGQPVSNVQDGESVTVTNVSGENPPSLPSNDEMLQTLLKTITESKPDFHSAEVEALRDHLATLKDQLREKDRQLEARNSEVSALLDQIRDMSNRLLPAPIDYDYAETEPEQTSKRRWWQIRRKVEILD